MDREESEWYRLVHEVRILVRVRVVLIRWRCGDCVETQSNIQLSTALGEVEEVREAAVTEKLHTLRARVERSRKNKEAVIHGEGRRKRMSGRKLGDGRAKTTRRVRQDGELQLPLEISPLKIECRARLFGAPWKREEVCRDLPSSKTFERIYTTINLKTYLRTERALSV